MSGGITFEVEKIKTENQVSCDNELCYGFVILDAALLDATYNAKLMQFSIHVTLLRVAVS